MRKKINHFKKNEGHFEFDDSNVSAKLEPEQQKSGKVISATFSEKMDRQSICVKLLRNCPRVSQLYPPM